MTERWLVTGGSGQVGNALRRSPPSGVEIFAPERDVLDLANLPDNLPALFEGVSAVINCGAYTAVDRAESELKLAEAINADAPGRLALGAAQLGIPIIHVSTDYVFPAIGQGPWHENAHAAPASAYGRTKLAGEQAVRASGARHAIVRTAWVVSVDGTNFVKTMLRAGAQNEVLRVVSDQRGTPTHAGDLGGALAAIARRLIDDQAQVSGTWHCTNGGETTWHGLAVEIFACAAANGLKVPREVRAITTAEYPTPARRPADSRLNCSRLKADFGIELRPWQAAIEEIIMNLIEEVQAA